MECLVKRNRVHTTSIIDCDHFECFRPSTSHRWHFTISTQISLCVWVGECEVLRSIVTCLWITRFKPIPTTQISFQNFCVYFSNCLFLAISIDIEMGSSNKSCRLQMQTLFPTSSKFLHTKECIVRMYALFSLPDWMGQRRRKENIKHGMSLKY